MRLFITEERGSAVEGEHEVAAVLMRTDGQVVERTGPETVTTWRSAAKPFQLEGSLGLLPTHLRETLSDEDIALGAASHSGQPEHVERVRSLFARLGGRERWLRCGAHDPVHDASARALWASGQRPEPIHNNCSGKHAFMACAEAFAARAASPDGYLDEQSPVQRTIRSVIDRRTHGGVVRTVGDGCGAPCFVLSLEAMATAWASLAGEMAAVETGAHAETTLARIGWAMLRAPWWMSGDGRLDLDVVNHGKTPIVSKVGAAGLSCLALPRLGLSLVVKVLTGADSARPAALSRLLESWVPGAIDQAAFEEALLVRNVAGLVVGKRRASWASPRGVAAA